MMTDADRARLAEIEVRLKAATPTPWEWRGDKNDLVNPNLYDELSGQTVDAAYWQKYSESFVLAAAWSNEGTADLEVSEADKQLIVNAPTDIEWLIEQLKAK